MAGAVFIVQMSPYFAPFAPVENRRLPYANVSSSNCVTAFSKLEVSLGLLDAAINKNVPSSTSQLDLKRKDFKLSRAKHRLLKDRITASLQFNARALQYHRILTERCDELCFLFYDAELQEVGSNYCK